MADSSAIMPQISNESDTQRLRIARTSRRTSTPLDLAPLHQALPHNAAAASPRLLPQQSRNRISSSAGQQQHVNPRQATGSAASAASVVQKTASQQQQRRRPSIRDSAGAASFPKRRPSTADGERTKWERPGLAESKKLFADHRGKGPDRTFQQGQGSGGRRNSAELVQSEGISAAAGLSPDILCQCFIRIESIYYLVNCASVCRAWREAMLSPLVWKTMYVRWHSANVDGSLDSSAKKEDLGRALQNARNPPEPYESWRTAFIGGFQEGKKELLVRERAGAVREGHLNLRQATDTYGRRVFDCTQGNGMQELADRLALSFDVCVHRGRHVKIQGKGKVETFQSSCIVRYPASCIGNLELSSLKSVEVAVTSDRLLRSCPLVKVSQLPLAAWETVSTTEGSQDGPLRLLQRRLISSGASMMVGTLAEELSLDGEVHGGEQVLLIVFSFHLSDLLWRLMELGRGLSPSVSRRVVGDEFDPHFGLHNWQVTVHLHTFGRSIWSRRFRHVFWNPGESILGDKAVLSLVSSQPEVFPGVLKLPWKSAAFSGSLKGVYLLDVTLWDGGGEIAWRSNSAVCVTPVPLAVVEYGIDFDGERVHTRVSDDERGVSTAIDMCIPLNMSDDVKPLIAITKLQIGLNRKFLESWCGVANI